METLKETLNLIAVLTSTVSTVYLLQEKFMHSGHVLALSKLDTTKLRAFVSLTNAFQLSTLLTAPTWPLILLNATLALSKIFIIKKF